LKVSFKTRLCIPLGDLESNSNDSIHIEEHEFVMNVNPFKMDYFFNKVLVCEVNSLNLLSIERQRSKEDGKYETDSTLFA
jgi:hypothetical protein